VKVIAVNTGDVWVGYDDVRKIAESLDAVCETDWEEGECEVRRAE